MEPKHILNLGCGREPLKSNTNIHYLNMDAVKHPGVLKYNLMKLPWPLQNDTFDSVFFFHTIEHIPEGHHFNLLKEIWRVLKPGGKLYISYPEFKLAAMNYINNIGGKRDFWKKVIYGRGLTEWDRHKALMDTEMFVEVLKDVGLWPKVIKTEKSEKYNTIVVAYKGEPRVSYEKMIGEEFAPST